MSRLAVRSAAAPAFSGPGASDVHVWVAAVDLSSDAPPAFTDILSPDERERAAGFLAERERRRFIVCRGVLRVLLGRYLGTAPSAVELRYGPHGKPAVGPGGGADLRFSVSHSRGLALYAIARGRDVGVDVEYLRADFPVEDIAQRFFSAREAAELRRLDAAGRVHAFFRAWTRKEAYLKATGEGLSAALRTVEVSLLPHESPALLATPAPDETPRWQLAEPFVADGYVAAVAVEGQCRRLWCRRWPGWPRAMPASDTLPDGEIE
jgi:4'-phosphopantetheinyl transferase